MERKDTFSLGVCNGCQLMVKQNIFNSDIKLTANESINLNLDLVL